MVLGGFRSFLLLVLTEILSIKAIFTRILKTLFLKMFTDGFFFSSLCICRVSILPDFFFILTVQCSETSSISTVSRTNASGSGASSWGSDGEDVFEISGTSPVMTSTQKQKTPLREDPCISEEAPAVNVNASSITVFYVHN